MRTQCRLREHGGCLPSLDEIATRLYVDINQINWILVMCSKCDTVMPFYEHSLTAKTTANLIHREDATDLTVSFHYSRCKLK